MSLNHGEIRNIIETADPQHDDENFATVPVVDLRALVADRDQHASAHVRACRDALLLRQALEDAQELLRIYRGG